MFENLGYFSSNVDISIITLPNRQRNHLFDSTYIFFSVYSSSLESVVNINHEEQGLLNSSMQILGVNTILSGRLKV